MASGVQTSWTSKKKKEFLEILSKTGNVTRAAKAVNCSRSGVYLMRDKDEKFRKEWDSAVEEAVDELEESARERALQGLLEPVYYQGEVVGHIRKPSDILTIFLLKGNRPEKYKDRVSNELTGKDGTPLSARTEVIFVDKK